MPSVTDVDWSRYDFIDLGSSNGGSLEHCAGRFGVSRGIGIDLSAEKVRRARAAGFDAVVGDARSLQLEGEVSFVSMLDFLEHLPSLDVAEEIIHAARRCARDFIYIKHPSFEGQERLEAEGLRQYWWNWRAHTCHLRVADYCAIFDRLGLSTYTIRYLGRVDVANHPTMVPLRAPGDLSADDAAAIDDLPAMRLSPPLWRRQDIFVALRPFAPAEWTEVVRPTRQDVKLMQESGQLPAELAPYPHLVPRTPTKRAKASSPRT